jgi:hypothetical protein
MAITHKFAENVRYNSDRKIEAPTEFWDGAVLKFKDTLWADDLAGLKVKIQDEIDRLSKIETEKVTLPLKGTSLSLTKAGPDAAAVARAAFNVKLRTYRGKKAAVALGLEAAKAETDAKADLTANPNPYLPAYSDDLIGVV